MVNIDAILSTNAIHRTSQGTIPANKPSNPAAVNGESFDQSLKTELNRESSVRISAHAQKRIDARNIPFGANETARLEQAVDKAANKGSRESLILMDDLALVVSIKNRVVITAVAANNRKDDVFTNIDSVVLS